MLHSPVCSDLEIKLLALLRQALREHKFDVADHLLRALECIDDKTRETRHGTISSLDEAYLMIAREICPQPSAKSCGKSQPRSKRTH